MCGHAFISLGYICISETTGSRGNSVLPSEKLPDYSPEWWYHLTFTSAVYEGSNFSTFLPTGWVEREPPFDHVHVLISGSCDCWKRVFSDIINSKMSRSWVGPKSSDKCPYERDTEERHKEKRKPCAEEGIGWGEQPSARHTYGQQKRPRVDSDSPQASGGSVANTLILDF